MSKVLLALIFVLAVSPLWALSSHHNGEGEDRVSFGNNITINEGETAGDVVCAFCSVHLRGDAHGDIAVLFGNVILDEGRSVSGDVAVLGGNVSLAENATISGDLALAAGDLHLAENAAIHGDRAVFSGRFWLIVPFAPLLILIGIIWLIVWFVRRRRYQAPYYAPPRRY